MLGRTLIQCILCTSFQFFDNHCTRPVVTVRRITEVSVGSPPPKLRRTTIRSKETACKSYGATTPAEVKEVGAGRIFAQDDRRPWPNAATLPPAYSYQHSAVETFPHDVRTMAASSARKRTSAGETTARERGAQHRARAYRCMNAVTTMSWRGRGGSKLISPTPFLLEKTPRFQYGGVLKLTTQSFWILIIAYLSTTK